MNEVKCYRHGVLEQPVLMNHVVYLIKITHVHAFIDTELVCKTNITLKNAKVYSERVCTMFGHA